MSSPIKNKEECRLWGNSKIPSEPEFRETYSKQVAGVIFSNPAFQRAKQVGLFAPLTDEVNIASLWFLGSSKCVFPKVLSETEMDFFSVSAFKDLKLGVFGILEPDGELSKQCKPWQPGDLLLIPGVAFDHFGTRVGRGKGYYDRYLSKIPPTVLKWGICWETQISSDRLPQATNDISMNAICSGSKLIECQS